MQKKVDKMKNAIIVINLVILQEIVELNVEIVVTQDLGLQSGIIVDIVVILDPAHLVGILVKGEIKEEDTPLSEIGEIVERGVIEETVVDPALQLNVIEIVHQQNYKMITIVVSRPF